MSTRAHRTPTPRTKGAQRVVVVGTGIAGLTAALEAHEDSHDVTVLTKSHLLDSSTARAQGGVAVVMASGDTVAAHVADTTAAGAGLTDPAAAQAVCGDGPAAVREAMTRGVAFDRGGDGELAFGLEAAHSHARILHAGGDATGARIAEALAARVRATGIDVREDATVTDLVVDRDGHPGRCAGVRLLDGASIEADVVVLATGGAGQLYPHTTNPDVATGDGVALALRAGAVVADLELVQFHPTALVHPDSFLVSEAVRGEGAILLDADGRRFMTDVHPDAELAPRDVVARGIAAQAARQGSPVVLDATALGGDRLAERFPSIDAGLRGRGVDWAREPVPVTPAAHYVMGGVRTDIYGRTSVPGLLAVGEVACTGLHGANRLASNSLLEGAVLATRAVAALRTAPPAPRWDGTWAPPVLLTQAGGDRRARRHELVRDDLQQLMWTAAGLQRDGDGLVEAAARLAGWAPPAPVDAKSVEDANLLLLARGVVASALARTESRGAHARRDHPATAPVARHTTLRMEAA